jgi:hypothetical protein
LRRLAKYQKLGLLEQFAIFMGMAQLLEVRLKQLLAHRFGDNMDTIDRWTLGRTAKALKTHGLRSDLVVLLESVAQYRNHIAHELLASEIMLRALLGGKSLRAETRILERGVYELEQLNYLCDWCDKHDAWQ